MAALVNRDYTVVHGKRQADEVPTVGLLLDSMQHHYRWRARIAPFQIVKIEAIDLDVPVHRLILHRKGNSNLPCSVMQRQPHGM